MNFYNLPVNIINKIYEFDSTYYKLFNKCVEQMNSKFNCCFISSVQWFTPNEFNQLKHRELENKLGKISSISYYPYNNRINSTFLALTPKFKDKAFFYVEYNWLLSFKKIIFHF